MRNVLQSLLPANVSYRQVHQSLNNQEHDNKYTLGLAGLLAFTFYALLFGVNYWTVFTGRAITNITGIKQTSHLLHSFTDTT